MTVSAHPTKHFDARTLRIWTIIHRWTSLVVTAFLLVLCITGLILIFQSEIDDFLNPPQLLTADIDDKRSTIEAIVQAAKLRHPEKIVVSLNFVKGMPIAQLRLVGSADLVNAPTSEETVDLRTGQETDLRRRGRGRFTEFLHRIHADLFLGLPGSLFLGTMAIIMIVAVISGIIVYLPFLRKFGFWTLRSNRSRRLFWLDFHNLTGVMATAWLLIVCVSGAINTAHDITTATVRTGFADRVKQIRDAQKVVVPRTVISIDAAIEHAREALPDTRIVALFLPGSEWSTQLHYTIMAQGIGAMSSELIYAVLVDAHNGAISNVFRTSGLAKALLLSEPIHFPTYGGLPLKLLWAAFDVIAIIVLVSGLYLWVARQRKPRALGIRSKSEISSKGERA